MRDSRVAAPRRPKPILGWREWVALPELDLHSVKAKVDTGARSSALHAIDVRIVTRRKVEWVEFGVHPLQDDSRTTVRCRARLLDKRWIKSSDGRRQLRPVIRTHLSLGGEQWPIELTLGSRDLMGFRMLLGREAIRGRFVVDAGRSFLDGENAPERSSKKKKKKEKRAKNGRKRRVKG